VVENTYIPTTEQAADVLTKPLASLDGFGMLRGVLLACPQLVP